MNSDANPLRSDPTLMAAHARVAAGELGQRLAVYAVARLRALIDDPLTVLGLPLFDELIAAIGERPVAVTSVSSSATGGLEQWSLVLHFPSELRASLDLGAGLGHAQAGELDLRIEWSGGVRAILVNPTAVAVTVSNARGHRQRSAEAAPLAEKLLEFAGHARAIAANAPPEWAVAAGVVAAARKSAATGQRVLLT